MTRRAEAVPRFSIVTPLYNPPPGHFAKCVRSVLAQEFGSWEWCIADDASPDDVGAVLTHLESSDARVRTTRRQTNGGISAASNSALELASGEWIVLLDQDDEFVPSALMRLAAAIDDDETVDMVYSDEVLIGDDGQVLEEYRKPAWSPSRLRSQMYLGHVVAYRRSLVEAVGGFRAEFDGSQDYDLALRISERARRVAHVPEELYRWTASPASVVGQAGAKPWAYEAGVRAVQDHCERVGLDATVSPTETPGVHRLISRSGWSPLVSIVIPTRGTVRPAWGANTSLVLNCVASILERSSYGNIEIVVVHDSDTPQWVVDRLRALEPRGVRLVEYAEDFNFSRKSNIGAFHALGDVLVFLNDDVEVITSGWLEAMLRLIEEGDVGIAGAKLVFPDSTLQHGGQFMNGLPDHVLYRWPSARPGPMSALLVERECEGVTAACAMVRRDVFEQVGGFTERLANNYNDVDFCLKVRAHGMRIVWTPHAELWHFESASRDTTVTDGEIAFIQKRWGERMKQDPYFCRTLAWPQRDPAESPLAR